MCTVSRLDGFLKCLDLAGFFLDGKMPIVVENKRRVNQTGDQYLEYRKFLAIAYSWTTLGITHGTDWWRHFL